MSGVDASGIGHLVAADCGGIAGCGVAVVGVSSVHDVVVGAADLTTVKTEADI